MNSWFRRLDAGWVLGFLTGLLIGLSVNAASAQCVGDFCDMDWESCTWVSMNSQTFNFPTDPGETAYAPFVISARNTSGGSLTSQITVHATTGNVFSYVQWGSSAGLLEEVTDIRTCSFYCPEGDECRGGEGGGVVLVPEDLALLEESFLFGFGVVGMFTVMGWAVGALLGVVSRG